jgi:chromosome segregation ATPase
MSNLLDARDQAFSAEEKAQLARLVSEMQIIKDQLTQVAVILEQLSQGSATQREQAFKWEAQFSEMKPVVQAMKVHVDSFPHALREARRSDMNTQKATEELSTRLREVESKIGIHSTAFGPPEAKG